MNSVNVTKKSCNGSSSTESVRTGRMNLQCALIAKCFRSTADGTARCDHVVNNGYPFSCNVQVLGFVNNGVSIDSGFLEIGKFTVNLVGDLRGSSNGSFVR